jgi:hypothetical protein
MKNATAFFFALLLLHGASAQNPSNLGRSAKAPLYLCDNAALTVPTLARCDDDSGLTGLPCVSGDFPTAHGLWCTWQAKSDGLLAFSIAPLEERDDLDFVLFRVPKDATKSPTSEVLRCMASGPNLGMVEAQAALASGQPLHLDMDCYGTTGLSETADGVSARPGCAGGLFLAPVQARAGERFLLFVNNYAKATGFRLSFSEGLPFEPIVGQCAPAAPKTPNPTTDIEVGDPQPNPATAECAITLHCGRADYRCSVALLSTDGLTYRREQYLLTAGEHTLRYDVSVLPPGAYFLQVVGDDGKAVVRKFVKE